MHGLLRNANSEFLRYINANKPISTILFSNKRVALYYRTYQNPFSLYRPRFIFQFLPSYLDTYHYITFTNMQIINGGNY